MSAFELDENHDVFTRGGVMAVAIDADATVQSIVTRLKLYLGEWWADLTAGTAWFQKVFNKPAIESEIETELKGRILQTQGVTRLTFFNAIFDRQGRSLTVQFEAETEFGPSGFQEVTVG